MRSRILCTLHYVCCLNCRDKFSERVDKSLLARRLIFQIATGITSAVIIKTHDIKSRTLAIYLFAYGVIELVLVCTEYPETISKNFWKCNETPQQIIFKAEQNSEDFDLITREKKNEAQVNLYLDINSDDVNNNNE